MVSNSITPATLVVVSLSLIIVSVLESSVVSKSVESASVSDVSKFVDSVLSSSWVVSNSSSVYSLSSIVVRN